MIRYLSYPIEKAIPVYGDTKAEPEIRKLRSFESGDTCETHWIGLMNHWGTHIDFPAHFWQAGPCVSDYDAGFWHFKSPQVIPVSLKEGECLLPENLSESIRIKTDLLLFRSGWFRFRGDDKYSRNNPGIHPTMGHYLRAKFPSVKAVGFDWVSLSSHARRDLGREAHLAFLDPSGTGSPILIIEDMDLSGNMDKLKEVWVAPLRVDGLDGSPATIFGVFND